MAIIGEDAEETECVKEGFAHFRDDVLFPVSKFEYISTSILSKLWIRKKQWTRFRHNFDIDFR